MLEDPRLRVVTLASEISEGLDLAIRDLDRSGTIVSLGHTDATYAQVREAVAAGARHTTHTYNAMRPLHHREPGTVGAALTLPELTCELIYDRVHVARPAAEVLLRCKGPDGVVAVSDGTMAAGLPPGTEIRMWGLDCVVGEGDVRLRDGTLAGSAITLLDAFRNLARGISGPRPRSGSAPSIPGARSASEKRACGSSWTPSTGSGGSSIRRAMRPAPGGPRPPPTPRLGAGPGRRSPTAPARRAGGARRTSRSRRRRGRGATGPGPRRARRR